MRYEGSALTTIVTAAVDTVIGAFRAGSREAYLREIHLFTVTSPATSGQLTIKRATTPGTGALTGNLGISRDPNAPAATGQVVTAWGTAAPVVTAAPNGAFRRFACSAAVGNGIIWTFYEHAGIIVPANGEVCICNAAATAPGTWFATFVYEE